MSNCALACLVRVPFHHLHCEAKVADFHYTATAPRSRRVVSLTASKQGVVLVNSSTLSRRRCGHKGAVGNEGVITVEEAKSLETELEVVERRSRFVTLRWRSSAISIERRLSCGARRAPSVRKRQWRARDASSPRPRSRLSITPCCSGISFTPALSDFYAQPRATRSNKRGFVRNFTAGQSAYGAGRGRRSRI